MKSLLLLVLAGILAVSSYGQTDCGDRIENTKHVFVPVFEAMLTVRVFETCTVGDFETLTTGPLVYIAPFDRKTVVKTPKFLGVKKKVSYEITRLEKKFGGKLKAREALEVLDSTLPVSIAGNGADIDNGKFWDAMAWKLFDNDLYLLPKDYSVRVRQTIYIENVKALSLIITIRPWQKVFSVFFEESYQPPERLAALWDQRVKQLS